MTSNSRRISFYRHYSSYTGGHQKVRDYLDHFISFGWRPSLFVQNSSATMPDLFNNINGVEYQSHYDPSQADVVFLAGMDWQHYLPLNIDNKPVINLIQHVRHGDPKQPLFEYLSYPATRLCVSQAVRDAISPYANGPCHVIKMGHQITALKHTKTRDLYILANKQPELGERLKKWAQAQGLTVLCHQVNVEKQQVINAMAQSRVTLTLPHQTEGFYLPGIEAMQLSDIAIVPDCIASREYSGLFTNTISCSLDEQAIIQSLEKALKMLSSPLLNIRKWQGRKIVQQYNLANERRELLNIVKNWHS